MKLLITILFFFILAGRSAAQNVGIGTASPVQKLDVSGSVNIIHDSSYNINNKRILSNKGIQNIFLGDSAGLINSGSANSFIGNSAGRVNTSGLSNSFLGYRAGYSNFNGNENTFLGKNSGFLNIGGSYNTSTGVDALYSNTSNFNTADGWSALYSNTAGNYNVGIGAQALYTNIDGVNNVGVGYNALQNSTNSTGNTSLGVYSGAQFNNGSYNTFIGIYADADAPAYTNSMALGFTATVTASNQVRIGNNPTSSIGGQVSWTSLSDKRVKNNIQSNVPGLSFIAALSPVTYHFDIRKENELLGIKNEVAHLQGAFDIEKITYSGFIAQDVDEAAKKIGYDFSGIDKSGKIWGLRYSEFVVPLVKAVQELSAENNFIKASLSKQEADINELKLEIQGLKKLLK